MPDEGEAWRVSPGLSFESITAVGKTNTRDAPEGVSLEPHYNKLTCVPAQQNNDPTRDLIKLNRGGRDGLFGLALIREITVFPATQGLASIKYKGSFDAKVGACAVTHT